MNPRDETHRNRLSKAMEYSYRELAPFRRSRRRLIEQFAGDRYGNTRTAQIYVNLIQQLVHAYQVALSYNEPRFTVSARRSGLKSFAERLKNAINNYSQKIDLGATLRQIIQDAIFQVGIAKLYLADNPWITSGEDTRSDEGIPFCRRVSLDNWGHDVTRNEFRYAQFMFDAYDMDLETARNAPQFNKKRREELLPKSVNQALRGDEFASEITTSPWSQEDEVEETARLVDVYLPKDRLIATFEVRDYMELVGKPLMVVDWEGPETGPYRFLSFLDVPDNIMPTSPAQAMGNLFDLHAFLMRKMARRARQERVIGTYTNRSAEDMNAVMAAEDMEYINIGYSGDIGTVKIPGPDQGLVSFTHGLYELYKQAAGNLDAMIGLAPTAGTATQSLQIEQKVTAQLAESRRRLTRFVSDVGTDVGEMLFDDPNQVIPGERKVPGTNLTIDNSFFPELREGSAGDYEIALQPYSMEFRSPAERLAQWRQFVQVTAPFAELFQAAGYTPDPTPWLEAEAEFGNEPRFHDFWKRGVMPMELPGSQGGTGPRGESVRRNVSERTGDGTLQQLMTQQSQNGEQATPELLAG